MVKDKTIQENIMSCNEPMNGNRPLFVMAALAGLACLPIVYMATRPIIWLLPVPWAAWVLMPLFLVIPPMVTFIILYCSTWHQEWPRAKRIFSMAASSYIIFGVDLFVIGLIVVIGCVMLGLSRAIDGN